MIFPEYVKVKEGGSINEKSEFNDIFEFIINEKNENLWDISFMYVSSGM